MASIDAENAREYAQTVGSGEDETIQILLSDAEKVFADEHVRNATLTMAHQLLRDRVVLGVDIEAIIEGVGLLRGAATIFRAALGLPIDGEATRRRRGRGFVGNAGFIDSTSTRYFTSSEETRAHGTTGHSGAGRSSSALRFEAASLCD